MKRRIILAVLGFALAMGSTQADVVIRIGPPRPVVERPGPPPGAGYVWMSGFHRWDGRAYVWVPGRWVVPPRPRAHWVPGHWAHARGGYYFVEGHWK